MIPPKGFQLDNGAQMIDMTPVQEGRRLIVLAIANGDEYVTWEAAEAGNGWLYCYWGHYFGDDIAEAVADYLERSGRG